MPPPDLDERAWTVSALCRAVSDALETRFNPVTVRGEIRGYARASSGHCYFTLKDGTGQIRCAMFRRAASLLDFEPRDGEEVQVLGRVGVYEARGDLQLVVESMQRSGQGALFEQFLRSRARLEAEGLFDADRKRSLLALPRAIGVITSPDAAAWHDVMTALRRRAPHVPVILAPALVQGAAAPVSLIHAARSLFALAGSGGQSPGLDVILVVRGGGSMEDLWAFNDETLVRCLATSPVPIVSGVGHETDFTLTDFVADVRAPTPTAAAEMAATDRQSLLDLIQARTDQIERALRRRLEHTAQGLDIMASRLGRPQSRLNQHHLQLAELGNRMQTVARERLQNTRLRLERQAVRHANARNALLMPSRQWLELSSLRLQAVDPRKVLARGYAWLADEQGHTITRAAALQPGQALTATLADGVVPLQVRSSGG
jgi:exodeoxyribonuclease VII large subunit